MQTYDEILKRMYDAYYKKMDVYPDEASDIGIRMQVLAGEVFSAEVQLEWLKNQMFPQTATGEYLERHALQRGLVRKSATKASGDIKFYLQHIYSTDIEIPEGTVCATNGENPVRFITTETVFVKAGTLGTLAPVEALTAGAQSNVAQGEVCLVVTPIPGVSYVENEFKITGGTDAESDEQLRARVLDSYINIPNGTNKAFYKRCALEVDGVTAVGVIPKARGAGTVDVLIMTQDGEPSQALIKKVKNHLSAMREINVDIDVGVLKKFACNVHVYISVKSGYEFIKVRESCIKAIKKYFSLLDAGETVYLSQIGQYIHDVDGVENYTFENNLTKDMTVPENSVAISNVISVTERVIR